MKLDSFQATNTKRRKPVFALEPSEFTLERASGYTASQAKGRGFDPVLRLPTLPVGWFVRGAPGKDDAMLAVAVAAVLVGLVFLFIIPWVGIPVGAVGLVLLVIWLVALARKSPRAAAEEARPR